MYTPGHTPACMVHVMGNAAFVGDTLFMPDGGSARADFPGGDAGCALRFDPEGSCLPDEMRLFMCHDYGPNGRDISGKPPSETKRPTTSMSAAARPARTSSSSAPSATQLGMPRLIIPSLQVNMRAGEIPTDKDGRPMLKVPVNGL
jgi:glyoxylase-like metal-dependent hydrolase (beta-lactamase superfamily II)